jgi:hypothetical protein
MFRISAKNQSTTAKNEIATIHFFDFHLTIADIKSFLLTNQAI